LGVEKNTHSTHSCRKGAITVVSIGCTVSPPIASICLRAGWTLGTTKDWCIHYNNKAGDQFCGRCVTGISSLKKEFATSPVYCDFTKSKQMGRIRVKKTLEDYFLNANEMQPHVFELIRYLFAALCFHFDFLEEKLPKESKLRAYHPLCNAISNFEFRTEAKIAYPWTATEYTPQQSGIPFHSMLLVEIEKLKKALSEQTTTIINSLKEELDNCSIGGTEYRTNEILMEVSTIVYF